MRIKIVRKYSNDKKYFIAKGEDMVAIIIGSTSDFPKIKEACVVLDDFGVKYDVRALSAHRSGRILEDYIRQNDDQIDVYIAGAGKAAHLPGVVAASTTKPVVGVPIKSSVLEGMDALLSIVQMPPGVPVATVAIDGAKNAALLAVQMIALKDERLAKKLKDYKVQMEKKVLDDEKKLLEELKL